MPDHIPLAMLNALAYCPRRFGYEFIQAEMLINAHVAEGLVCHRTVDQGGAAWLGDATQERRVYVWSERLGIAGFCDLIEQQDTNWYPVEYKKGRPGRWKSDHVQLCAQALCLEERTGQAIPHGFIFYFAARRREEVIFTPELRAETERIVAEAHRLVAVGTLPPPIDQPAKCRDCSLEPLCLPAEMQRLAAATRWEEELA
ncbi:MAG: CRISPR-associated protein Cas4 [Oscillochloridaceae bacterium umkhey_bin13]